MKKTNLSTADQQNIIKLVIAHELTHALQDQSIGLARTFRMAGTIEKSYAVNATIEGHAMFTQDQVADALKLGEVEQKFARALAVGSGDGKDPLEDLYNNMGNKLMRDVYLKGRDFIAWEYKDGGNDRLWSILAHPPVNTSMIYRPETYSPNAAPSADYAAILKGMEKRFGDRDWGVQNQAVGEIQFRSVYANMDEKDVNKIASNIEQAQALVAGNRWGEMVSVSIMVLRDGSIAPDMFSAIEKLTLSNVDKLNKSKQLKITSPLMTDFAMDNISAGRETTFMVKQDKQSYLNDYVRVCRGRVVVEMFAQKIDL
jgi:hypothetical protein